MSMAEYGAMLQNNINRLLRTDYCACRWSVREIEFLINAIYDEDIIDRSELHHLTDLREFAPVGLNKARWKLSQYVMRTYDKDRITFILKTIKEKAS